MGVKVELKDILSGFLSAAQHTANNTLVEEGLNKALDRTASVDNAMGVALDMGSNEVINLSAGTTPSSAVNKTQLDALSGLVATYEIDAAAHADAAYNSAQAAAASETMTESLYQDFTSNYLGRGNTLPGGTYSDGIRFYYTGVTYGVGEYIYLEGTVDPITSTNWKLVSGVGPAGPTGAEGIQGPIGLQGPQGIEGQQGIQGEIGIQGVQGIQGAVGNEGPVGPQGVQGDPGIQGVTGNTGATGATGPQGIQGPIGLTGAKGDAGNSFTVDEVGLFSGRSAYDAGADGFSYLATDHVNAVGTGSLFIKLSATNADWSDAVPFGVGPEGPQGAVGPTGATGPQGATGNTGATGPDGEQGIQGIAGVQGDQGPVGIQGPQGLQGVDGNQGPQGDAGIQGLQGDTGPTGATGPQGAQGNVGPTGLQGPVGPEGQQGPDGDQGIRGSRSYYTAGQTSWTAAAAVAEIVETPLENDVSVQYNTATSFSESRVYTSGDPTNASNWDVVDKVVLGAPITIGGSPTSFVIDSNGCIAFGLNAGVSGSGLSLAFGEGAGETSMGGSSIAIGFNAGNDSQGSTSVGIGIRAGENNQGNSATAIGATAARNNQGDRSTAIGNQAGYQDQEEDCIAIGHNAGFTGQGADDPDLLTTVVGDSLAIGTEAGMTNQKSQSIAIGNGAGKTEQAGYALAAGFSAGSTNQSALGTAVGFNAAYLDQGYYSVAVGANAGAAYQGAYGVAVGGGARSGTGDYNIAIGYLSDVGNPIDPNTQNSDNNTVVGYSAGRGAVSNYSNYTALGANSDVTGDDQVQLGDSATTTYAYGSVQNRSDSRDKADIADTSLGLDFIKDLRPVQFKWDYREDYRTDKGQELSEVTKNGSKKRTRLHQGFIAQEVKQTMDASGVDFAGYQDHSLNGGDDVKSLGYEEFIAPMVKAIQEQQALIEALTQRVEALENA